MTDRIPLDNLTSDHLDALYDQLAALREVARGYCPHCGRCDAAPTVADWEQQKQRADQAEATLESVRALRDSWLRMTLDPGQVRRLLDEITRALAGPGPAATEATRTTPYPDEQRERAETDMLTVYPPTTDLVGLITDTRPEPPRV